MLTCCCSVKMKNLLFLLVVSTVLGCSNKKFEIEPIDKEVNQNLLTLEGLDARLFSSKVRLQYFQVGQSGKFDTVEMKAELLKFVDLHYTKAEISRTPELNLFFYRKTSFKNYKKVIYETARDSENGLIEDAKDDLLAMVWFNKSPDGLLTRQTVIYNDRDIGSKKVDTLTLPSKKIDSTVQAETVPQKTIAFVKDDNCLTVKSQRKERSFEDCYEVDFLRVRSANEHKISLTFISGKSALDIDFYPVGDDWLSKEATLFGQNSSDKKGVTRNMQVSLRNFNYGAVADKVEGERWKLRGGS